MTDRAAGLRVGVDIGGSKIAVLVVDESGAVVARARVPLASAQPDAAVGQIRSTIDAALSAAGRDLESVAAVGVGVPGRVDTHRGTVTFAVNLGWQHEPLRERLEAALGVPCVIENDVRAAAAGLHQSAPFGPVEDLAYLSIGTGISAGIVLAGRLHRGVRGVAGEIGHVVLEPDGPLCACGLRGCFEALAAGPAIARAATEAIASGRSSSLSAAGQLTAVDVFAAAAEGDPLSSEIVDRVGGLIARAIHELVLAYDIELVVLGGGVSRAGEPLLKRIRAAIDRAGAASPFAAELLGGTAIHLVPADLEAGTWGAVALAERALAATVPSRERSAGTIGRGAGAEDAGNAEEVIARESTT